MTPEEIAALFEELIEIQRRKTLSLARRIDPALTEDDLFQPHDHPKIASHPVYQFEDGVLAGLLAARAAFLAKLKE
ncbi:MAG TPA: hypothetical protein VG777_02040 [Thermoanaerobaculia bacterium]|nr:hypothetical protein [Thermoanaerobaculia bacterium]